MLIGMLKVAGVMGRELRRGMGRELGWELGRGMIYLRSIRASDENHSALLRQMTALMRHCFCCFDKVCGYIVDDNG